MNLILGIAVFIIIVLVYLNAVEQYKKGTELEIYEMDYDNNGGLQRIIKKKQPVMFPMKGVVMADTHQLNVITLEKYAQKYGKEYVSIAEKGAQSSSEKPVKIRLEKALELLAEDDADTKYLSHNNANFVEDTSMGRYIETLDEYLQPSMCLHKAHDFQFGSKGAATPLQYHTSHSAFLYVARGQITIKMTPQKNERYLRGPFTKSGRGNTVAARSDLFNDPALSDEIPTLEFPVVAGWVLHIPPFWWYTYRFDGTSVSVATDVSVGEATAKDATLVATYDYTTPMNLAVKIPAMVQEYVQQYFPSASEKKRGDNSGGIKDEVEPPVRIPTVDLPNSSEPS